MENTDILRDLLEAVLGCSESLKIVQLRLRRYLVSEVGDRRPGSALGASGGHRRRIESSLSSTDSESVLGYSGDSRDGRESHRDRRESPSGYRRSLGGHEGSLRGHRHHRKSRGGHYRDYRDSRGDRRYSPEDYRESRKPSRDTPGSRKGPGRPRKVPTGELYSGKRVSRESEGTPPAAKKARTESREERREARRESREARLSVERPVLEAKRSRGRPKKPVDPNKSPVVKRRRGRPSLLDMRDRARGAVQRDEDRVIVNITSDISKDVEKMAESPYSRVSDAHSAPSESPRKADRDTEPAPLSPTVHTAAVTATAGGDSQGSVRRRESEVLSSPDSMDAVVVAHGSAPQEDNTKEDSLLLQMEEDEETAGEWWHSRRVTIEWSEESTEGGRQTVSGILLDSEPLQGASVTVRWPHPYSDTKYSATVLEVLAD